MIKLFLDDVRIPSDCINYMYKRIGSLNPIYLEEWTVVKNYNDFIEIITNNYNDITHISYDHDLADEHYTRDMYSGEENYNKHYDSFKERTGLDCAKFVKTFYHNNNLELPIMFVHSMNPVGTQNIINLWK